MKDVIKIRKGPKGKGRRMGTEQFRDYSKYNRKDKHRKYFDKDME